MNNRDLSACPDVFNVRMDGNTDPKFLGLTKLEYATIHLAAGMVAADTNCNRTIREIKEWSVKLANSIFDKLDQGNE